MKIGQITWWRKNYGSILQALALQKKIEQLGNDCEIICQYGKQITSFSNLKNKLQTIGFWKTIKIIIVQYSLPQIRKRTNKIQKFVNQNLKVSKEQYDVTTIYKTNVEYNAFVCGSDQIWNPNLTELGGFYWLNFVDENKLKFSYAPSVGVNNFNEEQAKIIKKTLKNFSGISCREETGTNAINEALGNTKCVSVLDPTLLVETDFWNSYSNKRLIPENYIFVYLLRGTKGQRKAIEKFANKHNLIIVTIPFLENMNFYDFKFGNIKYWDADPSDFISLIRYANYIFTDSFHSLIFSTIYHKKVYLFPKIGENQQSRLINFQKNILNCNITIENEDIDSCIQNFKEIDWNKVDKTIIEKRKKSVDFLQKSLKNNGR